MAERKSKRKEEDLLLLLILLVIGLAFVVIAAGFSVGVTVLDAATTETETPPPTARPTREPTETPMPRPDLVVRRFRTPDDGQCPGVEVSFNVVNEGEVPARGFRIGIEYVEQGDEDISEADYEALGDTEGPYVNTPVDPGGVAILRGCVTFDDLRGERPIRLWAVADSCRGESIAQDYCRVEESDERNNGSEVIEVPPRATTPADTGMPDLVVATLDVIGEAEIDPETGRLRLPIRVVVANEGDVPAAPFKVAVLFTADLEQEPFVLPFELGEYTRYPWTEGPLEARRETEFVGHVSFAQSWGGSTVWLTATADSCSGEEFVESFCHVQESDEENNDFGPSEVLLPFPSEIG